MINFQLPFDHPEKYPLTQKFGEQFMYRGKVAKHKGIDYGLPKFTPLLAPFNGSVCRVESTRSYGYGRTVYIKSENTKQGVFEALLAHCEVISVGNGVRVKRGQKVAESGRTGFWRGKNGYHVHIGLKLNGKYVDPLPYFKIKDPDQKKLFEDESRYKSGHGNHIVKEGESLWKIALKYYGNGAHYIEIFIANQDILEKPNLIHPGQELRIPILKNKGI